MKQADLIQLLQSVQYDQSAPPPVEQVVFRIQFKTVGSLGDFIMFSGRPKAGKSKYVAGAIAASLSRQEVFSMNIKLPEGKRKVAHFDTEQGKSDHYKMMQLIMKLANIEALPENFNSYRCRSIAPAQIIALAELYLQKNPECGLLYLDGLLDTVESMNDEKHSSSIKRWLKRITEDYNVLLAGVIHRGFGNDKSIGQIGSEGERAAQSVLKIEKDKDTKQYILRAEYMRSDDEFEPIAIQYNPQLSIWEQADLITPPEETTTGGGRLKSLKRRPAEYDIQEHSTNVWQIFNRTALFSYKDLVNRIAEVYATGSQWAKECVKELEKHSLIYRTENGFTNKQQTSFLKAE